MKTKEELKAERELGVFEQFSAAHGQRLDPGSSRSQAPPQPDIACRIAGVPAEFELVEITDQDVASSVAASILTEELTGCFFSHDEPLVGHQS